MPCNYTIFSKENKNLDQAEDFFEGMDKTCLYNIPTYLSVLSEYLYDDIELNIFVLRSENGKVFYPFFKRLLKNIPQIPQRFHQYYDIIGSWYYGGPMVSINTDKENLVKDYARAFSNYCIKENIIAEFVRFDPNIQNHIYFDEFYNIHFNRETVWVNLDQDYTAIWGGYKGRCRTAIRKALKSNIVVSEEISSDRIDAFAEIYQAEMERKADSKHYYFSNRFFHKIIQAMPKNFKFFFAFHNDTLCGGTIVYYKDEIAYDFLMATNIEFWKHQPNNILLDSAIKWAKSKGLKVFDLMGGRQGVFKFKSSFSNLRKEFFIGRKIHKDSVYSELEQITLNLTGEKYNSDFFPVYRQFEITGDK